MNTDSSEIPEIDLAELHAAREQVGIKQIETVLALRRARRRSKAFETMARRQYLDDTQQALLEEALQLESELRHQAATLAQQRRVLDDAIDSATVNRILRSVRP